MHLSQTWHVYFYSHVVNLQIDKFCYKNIHICKWLLRGTLPLNPTAGAGNLHTALDSPNLQMLI